MADLPDFERADRPWTAQPPPREGEGRSVHESLARRLEAAGYMLLADDLRERGRYGERKYGQRLQPHNGRRWDRDQYEELLDGLAYGEQGMRETGDDTLVGDLVELVILADKARKRATREEAHRG